MENNMTLKEQYEIEKVLLEALDPNEIDKFAKLFNQLDNIIPNSLPHLNGVVDKARSELNNVYRDKLFFNKLQKGVKNITGEIGKAKILANLIAFQGILMQFFRMLPSIMSLVGSEKALSNEVAKRLNALLLEKKTHWQKVASQLRTDKKQIQDAAKSLGIKLTGGSTAFTDEEVSLISAKLRGEPSGVSDYKPNEPNDSESKPEEPEEVSGDYTPNDALSNFLKNPEQQQRFEDYIEKALSLNSGGLFKSLLLGKQPFGQPFGLNPTTVASDMLKMPYDEFKKMLDMSKKMNMQVPISAQDTRELASAVQQQTSKTSTKTSRSTPVTADKLAKAWSKTAYGSKVSPNVLRQLANSLRGYTVK